MITWPFTAMGLSSILCIPRIALCGILMMGVLIIEPKIPPLVMVKVPPVISSIVNLLSFALVASSTTFASMPAMLKGWVDRVWGPGIAFDYDPKDHHLTPALHNIKLFGVVTSYGSPWWIVHLFAGNAGHKVLMRGMKPLCARDARSFYLAQYGMDASTDRQRHAFLEKVRRRVSQV